MSSSRNDPDDRDATFPLGGADDDVESMWVVVVHPSAATSRRLTPGERVSVGRSSTAAICIADRSISRLHAEIEVGPPLRIRDLGSVNGVRVRQTRLRPKDVVEIAPGDPIELGDVTLVVQRRRDAPASARTLERKAPLITSGAASTEEGGARLLAEDPTMRAIFELVDKVAPSSLSVLLLGETGVGKELLAEAIHRRSARASRPLIRLNCATLSETLLQSELFGHERGAFTGANQAKPGLLETANGGTVFLDEVGELPLALQAKLLRVVEERKVFRVGATKSIDVDLRFVSATNRNLKDEIARGTFRQDLYFRLNGLSIEIPPLRRRRAEIPHLARVLLTRTCDSLGRATPAISEDAMRLLEGYAWPGNVRELKNAVELSLLLAGDGPVRAEHLPREVQAFDAATSTAPISAGGDDLRSNVETFERDRIASALERCGGNQTRAAEMLGVSRRTLVTKLRLYDLQRRR